MIIERLEVGEMASNCYIVGDEATGEAMIVDPGDEAKRILDRVKALGLRVSLIANTHGHIDHVMAISPVKQATGVPFAMHPADVELAQAAPELAMIWFGHRIDPPPKPDTELDEGDTIRVGNLSFRVIHTPGHSPGGIGLYGEGVLFIGDTLFRRSIGRADFPNADQAQLIASIREKLYPLPDETIVYPGHGEPTTIGEEKAENPFVRP